MIADSVPAPGVLRVGEGRLDERRRLGSHQPLELSEDPALGSLASEDQAGDGDGDQQQRRDREGRVVGERSRQPRRLVLAPVTIRLFE